MCDLYEDLWLGWGAHLLGLTDDAKRIYSFVLRYQDESTGGFLSQLAESEVGHFLVDLRSTSLSGILALSLGDHTAGRAAAEFVKSHLTAQPAPNDSFYLAREAGTGRLANIVDGVPARYLVVSRTVSRPLFYALGLAIGFLALASDKLTDNTLGLAAYRFAVASLAFAPDCFIHDYSGKLFWAYSLIESRLDGVSFPHIAEGIGRHLCSRQLADGSWSQLDILSGGSSINLTSEYIFWLMIVANGGRHTFLVDA